ncbi:MAG: AzlC family ABC transporter permease [Rickettsiales bacterium]
MLDKKSFILGVAHSFPICIAFTLIYASLGTLGHARGISLAEMVVMSAAVFATPIMAFITSSNDLSIVSVVIAAIILQFKFILMATVLLTRWHYDKKHAIPSLHFLCASTYLVSLSEKNAKDPLSYYLGVSIPSYIIALGATALGYYIWDLGADHKAFLNALAHIVLPAHFMCLTFKRKHEKLTVVATLIGVCAVPYLGGAGTNIIVWVLIAAALVLLEEMVCGKQSLQQV